MYFVEIRPAEDLLFFTANKYKSKTIRLQVKARRSIKDLLESLGIPHVELGRIILDGLPSDMDAILFRDSLLDVYPARPAFGDRFLLDVHLGKLAANLRMLGFFADYSRKRDDAELEEISANRDLILLTCDRGLLMRSGVRRGMMIRSREPMVQTAEVVCRFLLEGHFHPFSRCIKCGSELIEAGSLEQLPPGAAAAVPPAVRGWVETYKICSACGRPYWKGSHFDGMNKKIEKILELSAVIRQIS
ncbi:MAG: hypothetical protein JEZ04_06315 [Spirochaetales bacterium]|nr:hypothetical protein [Spirochaetales bacterium]